MNVEPKFSARGFAHFPAIESTYGGTIAAYQSSAVEPSVWVRIICPADLNQPRGPLIEAVAHLRIEDAERLRDQLSWLVAAHPSAVTK